MDPFLAEFYGTGASPEEFEKTAQLEMLEKIAEDEGIDLNQLSPEEIEYILSEEEGDDLEKEAFDKFAEADFLGRVMAHANWDETVKIAAEEEGRLRRAGKWVKGKATAGARKVHGGAGWLGDKALSLPEKSDKIRDFLKKHPNVRQGVRYGVGYGGPTAAAAGAAYGGYKGYKHYKDKKSADEIVQERAAEFLLEAGIDPSDVFEKTAGYSQEDIDTAALSYLEDLGVPVTWY